MQHDDIYWPYDYAYNLNGHLSVNTWHGVTIDYAPNGRGQPTKAGTYATGVSYHPNGAMAQFTYGNGVLHTMSQNARGLPEYTKDAYGSTEFIDHRYEYDAGGNVLKITDGRPDAPNTRTMVYDDANRLKTTISPRFSSANYAYDVLDNISQMSIGGPNFRTHYYCYDTATWRLTKDDRVRHRRHGDRVRLRRAGQRQQQERHAVQLRLGESPTHCDLCGQSGRQLCL